MGCQRGSGRRKKVLAPGECWRIRPIDQDREACARRTEERVGLGQARTGTVTHRFGDERMGSDRAEAPGAHVWPKTARSRRGTGGKAGRGARSPKTRSVTSSARRRRAPSERGRRGQGGEGGSPSWTIGVRACRLRSRRGRRERGVEIHGAGGALRCRSLNRRHGRNETTGSRRSIRGSGDFPEIPLVAANDSDWTSYDAPAQRTQNLEFVRLTRRLAREKSSRCATRSRR